MFNILKGNIFMISNLTIQQTRKNTINSNKDSKNESSPLSPYKKDKETIKDDIMNTYQDENKEDWVKPPSDKKLKKKSSISISEKDSMNNSQLTNDLLQEEGFNVIELKAIDLSEQD